MGRLRFFLKLGFRLLFIFIPIFISACTEGRLKRDSLAFLLGTVSGASAIVGDTQITITWPPVTSATSYTIQYGTSPGVYTTTLGPFTSSPQVVTGLSNYTPYYFIVTATNSSGKVTTSPEITSTPYPAPTIISISNSFGPLAGGQTLTVTGTYFQPGIVGYIGTQACTTSTYVSATQMTCVTPSGSAGVRDVSIRGLDAQTAVLASSYTYAPSPTVTAIDQAFGPLGGGQTLTITGSGFLPGVSVTVGGLTCASLTLVNSTTITCLTPAGAGGPLSIVVSNADSQSGTLSTAYTYVAAPTLTSLDHLFGPTGGGQLLTLTGSGFLAGLTVSINGVNCLTSALVNSTTATCVTPSSLTGTYNVRIQNLDSQSATLAAAYSYVAAPTLASLSQSFGPTVGGQTLTLTGTGFQLGVVAEINGTSCTSSNYVSATSMTCLTPAASAGGPYTVRITNTDAQFGTLAASYTYLVAPTVSSISQAFGPAAGGQTLTFTGTGFQVGVVGKINGVNCATSTYVSATSLTCVTPAQALGGPYTVSATNTDTQIGSLSNTYSYVAAPTVATLSQTFGPPVGGQSVTFTGTGFQTGAVARINGVNCSATNVISSTAVLCTTPAQAIGGPYAASVVNTDAQSGTLAAAYRYVGPPTLTSLSTNFGPMGGGQTITLTGTGFQTGVIAKVNGVNCAPSTYVSATSMTCVTPAGPVSMVDVSVVNTDSQSDTLVGAYSYLLSPTVTAISQAFGPVAGGQTITITGSNFMTGIVASINGSNCTASNYVSATSMTCQTPAHAAGGPYSVSVLNTDAQSGSLPLAYSYVNAPTVTSLSQTFGPTAGGQTITFTGTGFQTGVSAFINGSPCGSTVYLSSTSLTCVTPSSLTGTFAVSVTNTDAQTGSLPAAYSYVAAPTVASLSQAFGPIAGGQTITFTGTGFHPAIVASINGVNCAPTTYVSATSLTCVTPAAAAGGPYAVSVVNTDAQTGSLAVAYSFVLAPTVTSLSQTFGPAAGGQTITFTGTGFRSGVIAKINGVNCTTSTYVSATTLTCVTPAAAAGTYAVSVLNTDAQTGSLAGAYSYWNAPTVTSLSQTFGPAAGGQTITFTGTGFQSGVIAKINGVNCTTSTYVSATSLTCVTPAQALGGPFAATVLNLDTQTGSLAGAYSYVAAPTLGSLSASFGPMGGGQTLTFTGTGFQPGIIGKINNVNCATSTYASATSMTCVTPPGAVATVDASVVNTDLQSATLASSYDYVVSPTVTAVSQGFGPITGGQTLTITGTNFMAGVIGKINGVNCATSTFVSASSMTCVTAAAAAGGPYSVSILNTDLQTGLLANAYSFVVAPTVTSLSQSFGPASGGQTITFTGTGFRAGLVAKVNGVNCTTSTYVSATSLTCVVPAAALGGPYGVSVVNTDAQSGSLATSFGYVGPPTFTSILPNAGALAGGNAVTINGTGFLSGATVTVGGVSCGSLTVVSSTQITCTTGAHAAGSVNVVVTNADTQSVTGTNAYTYQAAPTFTSIAPTAGALAGGTAVTVNGTGFLTGATVTVGGVACGSLTVVSSTQITCTTGAHAVGTVNVVVTNTDTQSVTGSNAYSYQAAPTFSSITPNNGALAGGTAVILNGTGFLSGATVTVGGVACSSLTVVSSTQITCTTGAHAAGAVNVVVTNTDTQNVSTAGAYTYNPLPTFTSIAPTAGALAGGTSVTVNGTGFLTGATVTVGGVACGSLTVVSSTQITCTTGAHAVGTVNVVVTNTDTQSVSGSNAFTYQAAPTFTSISPNAGALAGGNAVTVTGTGFLTGATVTLGGVACGSLTVVSSTQITCTTGAHAAGAVNVVVTNADTQSVTGSNAYTYQAAPTFSSISPSAGALAGGTAVTINGTGFLTGATVNMGGASCGSLTVVSANQITCTTSAHSAGATAVQITNTDGQNVSASNAYTYQPAPTFTSITPSTGVTSGGTAVTINGSGFISGATVSIGGASCTGLTVVSGTQVTCSTSANVSGAASVVITNTDAQTVTAGAAFTYICTTGYGSASCTACGGGTWDSIAGGSENCANCGAGSSTGGSSTASTCSACGIDTFSNGTANLNCTACGSGSYSGTGANTCNSCTNKPSNANSATYSGVGGGLNQCPYTSVICAASFEWNGNTSYAGATCNSCANGQWSTAGGTCAACANVNIGNYWNGKGTTSTGCSEAACTTKVGNSYYTSQGGNTDSCSFACSAGSGSGSCATCAIDTYSAGGSLAACSGVSVGQYAPAGASAPTNCTNAPVNSTSVTYSSTGGGANACNFSSVTCAGGYAWNGNTSAAGASCDVNTRQFACQRALPGWQCGNGRASTFLDVADINAAITSCQSWATANSSDFCNVTPTAPIGADKTSCQSSGRKWVSNNNCCLNYECTVGQWGSGAGGPCSPCTNQPAGAASVTYSTPGCAFNKCDYGSVTCSPGYVWNGNIETVGAACNYCGALGIANASYDTYNSCSWSCDSGYTWDGSSCVYTPPVCMPGDSISGWDSGGGPCGFPGNTCQYCNGSGTGYDPPQCGSCI